MMGSRRPVGRLLGGRQDGSGSNHASTALGKCRALKERCAHPLAHSLLREKKYGKMQLKVLRNSANI